MRERKPTYSIVGDGGLFQLGDFHNSHNRVQDWIKKTKTEK